jgi:hypothetical protein
VSPASSAAQIAVPRFTDAATTEWTQGDVAVGPHYTKLTPGLQGGHWTDYGGGTPWRLFGLRAFTCDLADSPIRGLGYEVRQMLDDKQHNVWIDAGWRPDGRRVFVKRLSEFRLERPELPAKAARLLEIEVKALLGGEPLVDARLFYRLNGGPWLGGGVGPKLTIEFPEDGTYEVEVIGMEPLGGTTPEGLKFSVESKAE